MQRKNNEIWPINQVFIFFSSAFIILVILKYSAEILTPFLISLSLAIVLSPLLVYLEKKHVPKMVSLLIIVILSLIPIIVVGSYIGKEIQDFANNFQDMSQNFSDLIDKGIVYLNKLGISITHQEVNRLFENSSFGEIIKDIASQIGDRFSNIFLIIFIVSFMLLESKSFYDKMIKIAQDYGGNLEEDKEIIEKIKSYFLIKVKTSLLTALLILVVLWYFGSHYYYLWATLAFFLNFIPVIGSILAAIPPIVMAFINQNPTDAFWILLWYMIINLIVGNVIEPRVMGRGLGLSVLIIFLSMTFWGWIFGPTGMILSVPLTMVAQHFFGRYDETKWIALLLSDYK